MSQSGEPKVRIGQVFVSSVAFEHREDALQLSPKTDLGNLTINVSVQVGVQRDGNAGFVKVIVATDNEQNPLYRFAVEMSGIIEADEGAPLKSANDYLINSGAFMMYPFLREFVANLTTRGRFGPVWLRPMNFRAITEGIQRSMDEGATKQALNAEDHPEE
jgi:preprotein translocase subunit SecB